MTDIIANMRLTSSIICIVEEGELLSALYFVYFGGDFSEIRSPSSLGSLYFDKVDVLQISRLTVPGSGIGETEAAAAGIVGVHIGFSQVVGVAPGIRSDVAYSVVVAIVATEAAQAEGEFLARLPILPVVGLRIPVAQIGDDVLLPIIVSPDNGAAGSGRAVVGKSVPWCFAIGSVL